MSELLEQRLRLKFFSKPTYATTFDGYIVHLSRSTDYQDCAAVEDYDGTVHMVDVSDLNLFDFGEKIKAVINRYEGE